MGLGLSRWVEEQRRLSALSPQKENPTHTAADAFYDENTFQVLYV